MEGASRGRTAGRVRQALGFAILVALMGLSGSFLLEPWPPDPLITAILVAVGFGASFPAALFYGILRDRVRRARRPADAAVGREATASPVFRWTGRPAIQSLPQQIGGLGILLTLGILAMLVPLPPGAPASTFRPVVLVTLLAILGFAGFAISTGLKTWTVEIDEEGVRVRGRPFGSFAVPWRAIARIEAAPMVMPLFGPVDVDLSPGTRAYALLAPDGTMLGGISTMDGGRRNAGAIESALRIQAGRRGVPIVAVRMGVTRHWKRPRGRLSPDERPSHPH